MRERMRTGYGRQNLVQIIYNPSQRERRKGEKGMKCLEVNHLEVENMKGEYKNAKWKKSPLPGREGGKGKTQRGRKNESNELQWEEWKSKGLDVARDERN